MLLVDASIEVKNTNEGKDRIVLQARIRQQPVARQQSEARCFVKYEAVWFMKCVSLSEGK